MKIIPLTLGLSAMVDDDQFERLTKYKWHAHQGRGRDCYAEHSICKNKTFSFIKMHHFIIGQPIKGKVVDHIDGNGLNNQKLNLRVVTIRQNSQNRHHLKISQYPGVTFNKTCNRPWIARAVIEGERKYLGCFSSEKLAYQAYEIAILGCD